MTDKQPKALQCADDLDSFGFGPNKIAALIRTQHAAIERKDALLRQALETWDTVCDALNWDRDHMAAFLEIRKELSQ